MKSSHRHTTIAGLALSPFVVPKLDFALHVTEVDFERRFGADLPEHQRADTVGGYLFTHLGRLPEQGEVTRVGKLEFKVLILKGTRIKLLEIRRLDKAPGNDKQVDDQ